MICGARAERARSRDSCSAAAWTHSCLATQSHVPRKRCNLRGYVDRQSIAHIVQAVAATTIWPAARRATFVSTAWVHVLPWHERCFVKLPQRQHLRVQPKKLIDKGRAGAWQSGDEDDRLRGATASLTSRHYIWSGERRRRQGRAANLIDVWREQRRRASRRAPGRSRQIFTANALR